MRKFFLATALFLAALTGCGSTSTDLTATNEAIGANTTAVDNLGSKVDASSTAVVDAINNLGGKLDSLAPAGNAPVAKVDPNVCAIPTGMVKIAVDDNGNAKATQDALVNRGTAVIDCDVETAPDGWRAWEVSGLRMGSADDGQDGLMVDSHGKALKPAMLRGITSTKFATVKGTHFTARCIDISSTGKGCATKKTEKPDTVMVINGRKVTISGS